MNDNELELLAMYKGGMTWEELDRYCGYDPLEEYTLSIQEYIHDLLNECDNDEFRQYLRERSFDGEEASRNEEEYYARLSG